MRKKISLIKKNLINLIFMIFAITMVLYYNGKNPKYQIIKFFLIKPFFSSS